jgi:hypothetical protein
MYMRRWMQPRTASRPRSPVPHERPPAMELCAARLHAGERLQEADWCAPEAARSIDQFIETSLGASNATET